MSGGAADALERIESKIAHLERSAVELSDVVFRQQQEIRVLEAQLQAVRARLFSAQAENFDSSADHERPPHY